MATLKNRRENGLQEAGRSCSGLSLTMEKDEGKKSGPDYFIFHRLFILGNATTSLRPKTAIDILLIRHPLARLDDLRGKNFLVIVVSSRESTSRP